MREYSLSEWSNSSLVALIFQFLKLRAAGIDVILRQFFQSGSACTANIEEKKVSKSACFEVWLKL